MSAVFSPCGSYRYRLERDAGMLGTPSGPPTAFVMVNPSTADEWADDATIRKVRGFAARLGFGRIIVGNLFAWRAIDIRDLRSAPNPIGPDNDRHLDAIIRESDTVIVAWGASGKLPRTLRERWRTVVDLAEVAGKPLHCIGTARDGHPLHPLMQGYDRPLVPWATPTTPEARP